MGASAIGSVRDVEHCEECGFTWGSVANGAVAGRIAAGAEAIADLLRAEPAPAVRHPLPDRWSALEYSAHVRDVLLMMRDRVVVGLVEDEPGFKPMYREERVDLGLYREDQPLNVADEVVVAATMFGRLFGLLTSPQLAREVQYGYPGPARRTIAWLGQQSVHEVEHHLDDMRAMMAATDADPA